MIPLLLFLPDLRACLPYRKKQLPNTFRALSCSDGIRPSLDAGQFIQQNIIIVVAFVISFSVLIAGIVAFGKKKE